MVVVPLDALHGAAWDQLMYLNICKNAGLPLQLRTRAKAVKAYSRNGLVRRSHHACATRVEANIPRKETVKVQPQHSFPSRKFNYRYM